MKLYEILEEATRRDFLKGMGAAAVTGMAGSAKAEKSSLSFEVPYKEAILRVQDGIARDYHSKGTWGLDYNVVPTVREGKAKFEIFYNHIGKPRPHSNLYVYDRGDHTEITYEDAPERPKRFKIGKHLKRLEKNVQKWMAAAVNDDF